MKENDEGMKPLPLVSMNLRAERSKTYEMKENKVCSLLGLDVCLEVGCVEMEFG